MFFPDTPIALDDGTQVPIRGIDPGVILLATSGDKCKVLSCDSQWYDGDIIHISYQDEGLVRVTPDQVIVTDRGKIAAYLVCPGERLCTPLVGSTGMLFWDVESTRRVQYAGHVFRLRVDGDGCYVASGIIVA